MLEFGAAGASASSAAAAVSAASASAAANVACADAAASADREMQQIVQLVQLQLLVHLVQLQQLVPLVHLRGVVKTRVDLEKGTTSRPTHPPLVAPSYPTLFSPPCPFQPLLSSSVNLPLTLSTLEGMSETLASDGAHSSDCQLAAEPAAPARSRRMCKQHNTDIRSSRFMIKPLCSNWCSCSG